MSNIRKLILNGYFLFSLLIVVNLSLQLLPLTSETGYEFSAANSVLFFFIGGLWYLTLIEKETGVKKNLFVFFLFLIVPLLISVLNTAFIRNCPVCFGIPFYFIISLPAFFFGAVIIKGISVLSNRFRIILFLIVFLLLCIIPVLEIYFLPQIYFYHPVITFFPGTMYDELIPIDEKMILYRGLNLIFFFALFLFFSKDYFVGKKFTSVALIFISVVVWYFLFKPLFGFDTTNSKIQNELSNKIKTEHIDIYY